MRRLAPSIAAGLLATLLLVGVGCSDDGSSDDAATAASTSTTATDGSTSSTVDDEAEEVPDGTDTTDDATDDPAGEPIGVEDGVVALTSTDVCERIDPAEVTRTIGFEIAGIEEGDGTTAQCRITYSYDSGDTARLTVSSFVPADLGGRTGDDAFDYVVEVNERRVGEVEDSATPDVGERAVRLSGESLHVGVVSTGDRLLTVAVPAADVDGDQVDAFLSVVAETFA